jgi:hypothetical protein
MFKLLNNQDTSLTRACLLTVILTCIIAAKRPEAVFTKTDLRSENQVGLVQGQAERLGFTAKLVEHIADLQWNSIEQGKVGYYTIEKSDNGSKFREVAILMTGENESADQVYRYQDKLRTSESKKIYYRVRLNYIQGNMQYSDLKRLEKTPNDRSNH